jgi:hypothetical protein
MQDRDLLETWLVRQVGLEEYFREYGWNDFCRPVNSEDFECR